MIYFFMNALLHFSKIDAFILKKIFSGWGKSIHNTLRRWSYYVSCLLSTFLITNFSTPMLSHFLFSSALPSWYSQRYSEYIHLDRFNDIFSPPLLPNKLFRPPTVLFAWLILDYTSLLSVSVLWIITSNIYILGIFLLRYCLPR